MAICVYNKSADLVIFYSVQNWMFIVLHVSMYSDALILIFLNKSPLQPI